MEIKSINPSKCKMWEMHDRLGEDIDSKSCASLIQSIGKHGQKHAVLGRRMSKEDGYEIELIYGARRLFASRQLGINLLVEVRELDDLSGLVEMDIENRVRSDISSYERGMSYRRWLRSGYFKSQADLAKALSVSEAHISRLLRFSDLPAAVVNAFNSPHEIKETWAIALSQLCQDASRREAMLKRARLCGSGNRPRSPDAVYNNLMNGSGKNAIRFKTHDEIIRNSQGVPLFRMRFGSANIQILVPRSSVNKDSLGEIADHVREILDASRPAAARSSLHIETAALVQLRMEGQEG